MARKPMVTRSFEVVEYTCICMDMTTLTAITKTVELTRVDEKKVESMLHDAIDTDSIKFVSITAQETRTRLLGMTEQDFIKYAVELDATTRKVLEDEGGLFDELD